MTFPLSLPAETPLVTVTHRESFFHLQIRYYFELTCFV